MMWRDVLDLITVEITQDDVGGFTEQEFKRTVFANRKSIRSTEFYQAHAVGLRPEITFEIRFFEYQNEKRLEFQGVEYEVLRTFSKNQEMLDLICARREGLRSEY